MKPGWWVLSQLSVETPIEQNQWLCFNGGELLDDSGMYQRLFGRLIFFTITQPDIGFSVSFMSQFIHAPHMKHLRAFYRILRYLKKAPGKGILYP